MIRAIDVLGNLTGWRRLALALAAGAGAACAMPPLDAWPLLFAVFPVLMGLTGRTTGVRAPFAVGWCFGFGYFAVCLHWIGFAFLVDAESYLWMMPFAVGGLAGFMALYWGAAVAAAALLRGPGLHGIAAMAACFTAAEWLRGQLFTGFPWTSLGLAADGMGGLAQVASLIGMNGLTFWVVLWACLPMLAAERRHMLAGLGLAALLPALWVWGEARLAAAAAQSVTGVGLRIVQPNIPQNEKWREGNAAAIFEKLLAMSRRADGASGVTHLIWPESAVPFFIDESPAARAEIAALLPDGGVLIMGALRRDDRDKDRVYNSVLAFDDHANVVLQYDKWRLVPGGEFLPMAWLLEPLGFRKVVRLPGSFAVGSGPATLPVPGAPAAGLLICYEAIFPGRLADPAERPGWLINVTNDGWFGASTGPHQHLAQARMRAIEEGLPVVRAANTGISAVIDGYGRILERLPLGGQGVIDAALPVALPPTIWARFPDLGTLLAAGLAGLVAAARRFQRIGSPFNSIARR